MRNEFLLCSVLALLAGCSSSHLTSQQKDVKLAWTAQKVHEATENKKTVVDISYVIPFRGGMRHLDYGYGIRISGNTLCSYPPYYGRAYNIPYGGGEALVSDAPIQDYAVSSPKKGLIKMDIYVENDEDRYAYMMEIFDNGQVNLLVKAQKREQILLKGKLIIKDEKEQQQMHRPSCSLCWISMDWRHGDRHLVLRFNFSLNNRVSPQLFKS